MVSDVVKLAIVNVDLNFHTLIMAELLGSCKLERPPGACTSFDLTNLEQQRLCFNYTNLQPLWATDNLSKSDKW